MSEEGEFQLTDRKTPFVKAVTNEGFLFFYRVMSLAAGAAILWFAQDMRASQAEMREVQAKAAKDIAEFRIIYTGAIASMQGDIKQLDGRINIHADRLNSLGADIRDINGRLYNMHKPN